MNNADRLKYLRIALVVFGAAALLLYPLTIVWPAGWAWHHGVAPPYTAMLVGVYATLGVFLILAARDPATNASLIWFTVWSSLTTTASLAGAPRSRNRRPM